MTTTTTSTMSTATTAATTFTATTAAAPAAPAAPGRRPAAGRWFTGGNTAPDPSRLRLYCLPHAGGGASAYRAWAGRLGTDVEIVPVQLPGRESRFAEPAATTAAEIADGLCAALVERADQRWALFGHSMGALLAYEVACRMTELDRAPGHLVVSGMTAPPLVDRPGRRRPVRELSDAELSARIHGLGGTPDEVLRSAELMELLLPVFRADFRVCDDYRFVPGPPLDMPLTVLGGAGDRGAPVTGLAAWRGLTTGAYTMRVFPGGHFYLNDHLDDVLATVRTACADVPPAGPAHRLPHCLR